MRSCWQWKRLIKLVLTFMGDTHGYQVPQKLPTGGRVRQPLIPKKFSHTHPLSWRSPSQYFTGKAPISLKNQCLKAVGLPGARAMLCRWSKLGISCVIHSPALLLCICRLWESASRSANSLAARLAVEHCVHGMGALARGAHAATQIWRAFVGGRQTHARVNRPLAQHW